MILKSNFSYDYIYDWTLLSYSPEVLNKQKIAHQRTVLESANDLSCQVMKDEEEEPPAKPEVKPEKEKIVKPADKKNNKKCEIF